LENFPGVIPEPAGRRALFAHAAGEIGWHLSRPGGRVFGYSAARQENPHDTAID
jgi:hypothetical protein